MSEADTPVRDGAVALVGPENQVVMFGGGSEAMSYMDGTPLRVLRTNPLPSALGVKPALTITIDFNIIIKTTKTVVG